MPLKPDGAAAGLKTWACQSPPGAPLTRIVSASASRTAHSNVSSTRSERTDSRIPTTATPQIAASRAALARQYDTYIVAQCKARWPEVIDDRFFNTLFVVSPHGEVVHKAAKNHLWCRERSCVPHDVYDRWTELFGDGIDAFYPVLRTPTSATSARSAARTASSRRRCARSRSTEPRSSTGRARQSR